MTLRWRSSWLFPLVLAVILGGLSAWLDRISEVTVEETALNPNQPQYQMSGIAGKRFDQQGNLSEILSAEKAWQMPKREEVEFEQPQLKLFRQGQEQYQISSKNARYHTDSRQVNFEHEVVLTKAPSDGHPQGLVKTSSLTVDTRSQNAHTDAQVQFTYGQSTGTADGLTYNHDQGLLNLPSRVKAIIYDAKQP